MSMHKAIVATGGIGVTPNRPGKCEEGMASGSCAPSEPSLSPPGIYSPESPLSSCSLNSTVWGPGWGEGVMQSGKGRTPLGLPPEKAHMTEGKAGAGGKEGTRQAGAEDADR